MTNDRTSDTGSMMLSYGTLAARERLGRSAEAADTRVADNSRVPCFGGRLTMASEHLTRCFAGPIELRADCDGRTVFGLAVPYGSSADIPGGPYGETFRETFRAGAFAKSIAERGPAKTKLLAQHGRGGHLPVGRATALREDPSGLIIEGRISETPTGDEVLQLIRDGVLDSFSVGFDPIVDSWSADRTSVERVEARLREVSLTPFPAYADALVGGVRDSGRSLSPEAVRRRLELLERL
jgi:HK97 family phage prohead protease